MVSLFINGKKVEAEPSQTILQAANKVGIHIPTLCHDPRLTPSGACRMCVVEVEGARSLVASCATPVSEGMKINTQERVSLIPFSGNTNECFDRPRRRHACAYP